MNCNLHFQQVQFFSLEHEASQEAQSEETNCNTQA